MIVVLLGPPGSGKGTQAHYLEQRYDFLHLATGDLMRAEIAMSTPLGEEIRSTVESGGFPNDEIVIQLVDKILQKQQKKNIIFDGFPRTVNQALALDSLLGVKNLKADMVLYFNIDLSKLLQRVTGRSVCANCGAVYHDVNKPPKVKGICDDCGSNKFDRRQDDTQEVLEKRIKIYNQETAPIREYYKERGILTEIDASQDMEQVYKTVIESLSMIDLLDSRERN